MVGVFEASHEEKMMSWKHHIQAIAAATLCFMVCASVLADGHTARPWARPFEHEFRSAIDPDALEILNRELSLTDDQAKSVEQHYTEHVARFAAFVAENKSLFADLNRQLDEALSSARELVTALEAAKLEFALHPEGDADAVPQAAAKALAANFQLLHVNIERETRLADIADAQAGLDELFFDEIAAMLSEEQAERLPRCRDELRRRAWLGKTAMYAEERVDLVVLVEKTAEQLNCELNNAELDDLLRSYSQQVVVPLRSLAERAIQSARRYYREHQEAGHWIPGERAIALDYSGDAGYLAEYKRNVAKTQQLHRTIRDLNHNFKVAVEALLPEALRSRFHEAYIELALRSYVRISAMPGLEFVQHVRALDSLAPQQLSDIDDLTAAHVAQVAMLQDRILRAADSRSGLQLDMKAQLSKRRNDAQMQLDMELEAYRKAEATFIDVVWMVLTPEQQAQLTKPSLNTLPR